MKPPNKDLCTFYSEIWVARNFYRSADGYLPKGGCLLQIRPKQKGCSPCTGCIDFQPGHLSPDPQSNPFCGTVNLSRS